MPKVRFGLKNTHYSIITEITNVTTGAVISSYGPTQPWKGSVSIVVDPQGEDTIFYADDGDYFLLNNNNGYSGDFVSALVPEDVYTEVYGQTKDANGVITESKYDVKKYIAFMFESMLDNSGRRYILYRCSLTRNSIASNTKGENVEVQTESVTITATPRPDDGKIRSFVDKGQPGYDGWYQSVYAGGNAVPSISLPQSITLANGESAELPVTVVPADATVTWSSSNNEVASVTSGGVVTAEASTGNAIITASITIGGVTYTATTTVICTA